jgi:integrase
MNGVEPPKWRPRTVNFLSTTDAGLLLDACRALPNLGADVVDVVDVILGTGLRVSEALGLVVGDVHVGNVDRAWIDVEMQLSRDSAGSPESRRVSLKTEASHRRVAVDPSTARVLARLVADKRRPPRCSPTRSRARGGATGCSGRRSSGPARPPSATGWSRRPGFTTCATPTPRGC